MASAVKPYEGRDFYVPEFEIKIGRSELSKEVVRDIIQVRYKDSTEDVANFEITINNWDAETRSFKYSGAKTKKELIRLALKEFVEKRRRLNLLDLEGKIEFAEDYDYKKLRERQ